MSLTTSKPLQYDNIETVFRYLSANLRFQISLHMPSLQKMEKRFPLKIDKFVLGEYEMNVDGHTYDIAVKRVLRGGPDFVNVYGDLDEYGFQVSLPSRKLTPGDFLLRSEGMQEELSRTSDESERFPQKKTQLEEKIRFNQMIQQSWSPSGRWKEKANNLIHLLAPFHNLENNTLPTYDTYTQLTITSQDSARKIYRAKYISPLFQGVKYLTKRFFENRHLIQINCLSFEGWVARLPVGVKFKVYQLEGYYDLPLLGKGLSSIFDETIKTLTLKSRVADTDIFKCPLIQGVSRLTIAIPTLDYNMQSWTPLLQQLPNREIIYNMSKMSDFNISNFLELIEHWRRNGRETGSKFEVRSVERYGVRTFFKLIKRDYAGDDRIIIPMVDQNSIVIQFMEIEKDKHGNLFSVQMESVKNVDL